MLYITVTMWFVIWLAVRLLVDVVMTKCINSYMRNSSTKFYKVLTFVLAGLLLMIFEFIVIINIAYNLVIGA